MPTATGGETIGERLTRLRAELARVRTTIERHEGNGQSVSFGGTAVTEIAYERALARQEKLEREIRALEARLSGQGSAPQGLYQAVTRMHS